MQHSKGLSIGSPFVLLKKKTPVRMSEGGMWGSEIATCRNNRQNVVAENRSMGHPTRSSKTVIRIQPTGTADR